MIEKFEAGKKYRWIGPVKPSGWSIPDELSTIWEKGGIHKCIKSKPYGSLRFKGIYSELYPRYVGWAYAGFESNFEVVE